MMGLYCYARILVLLIFRTPLRRNRKLITEKNEEVVVFEISENVENNDDSFSYESWRFLI